MDILIVDNNIERHIRWLQLAQTIIECNIKYKESMTPFELESWEGDIILLHLNNVPEYNFIKDKINIFDYKIAYFSGDLYNKEERENGLFLPINEIEKFIKEEMGNI